MLSAWDGRRARAGLDWRIGTGPLQAAVVALCRQPVYSLTPKKTADGRDFWAVPASADLRLDDEPLVAHAPAGTADRKIKYYRNPMGLANTSPRPNVNGNTCF